MSWCYLALWISSLFFSSSVYGRFVETIEPEHTDEENIYLDAIKSIEQMERSTRKLMFSYVVEQSSEDTDRVLGWLKANLKTPSRANTTREGGETLLMAAASQHTDPRFVQAILDAGGDVYAVDDEGRTALMYNAMSGASAKPDIAHALIAAGSVIDARDHLGRTPLMYSVQVNHKGLITEELVKYGADVNLRDRSSLGQTPLMYAAKNCTNILTFSSLLENGADVEQSQHKTSMRALHLATLYSSPEIVELLVEHGAQIDSRMDGEATALLLGLSQSVDPQVIIQLVELGADVSVRGVGDASVIRVAVISDQPVEVFDALMNAGADIHERSEDDPMTLFEYLCMKGTQGEVVGRFVDAGADPNLAGMFNVPPLSSMIYNNRNASMVAAIIAAGAEVDAVSHAIEPSLGDGWAAIHIAAMYSNDVEVVRALVKGGADVNKVLPLGDMGFTPLFLTLGDKVYNPDILLELVQAGADVKVTDAKGKTLIDYIQQVPRLRDHADVVTVVTNAME